MIPTKPTIVELDRDELEEILRRVDAQELQADDYETIHALIESYVGLTLAVGDKNATIARLRQDALRREDREDRGGGRRHDATGGLGVAQRRRPVR